MRNIASDGSNAGRFEATDLYVDGSLILQSNDITELKDLATAEIQQLENIGSNTISATQWGYIAALNQNLASDQIVTFDTVQGTHFNCNDYDSANIDETINIGNGLSNKVVIGQQTDIEGILAVDQITSLTTDGNLTLSGNGTGVVAISDSLKVNNINSNGGELKIGEGESYIIINATQLRTNTIAAYTGGGSLILQGNAAGNIHCNDNTVITGTLDVSSSVTANSLTAKTTNGNLSLAGNGTGNVSLSKVPIIDTLLHVRAYRNTTVQTIEAGGGGEILVFNATSVDNLSGAYSTTTGIFTAPAAMLVFVSTSVRLELVTGSSNLSIRKNSTAQQTLNLSADQEFLTVSGMVTLALNDTIDIFAYSGTDPRDMAIGAAISILDIIVIAYL